MIQNSPRKVVPLASGDDYSPRSNTSGTTTTRAFFAAVVVEGAENNAPLDPDVHDLVISLGKTIDNPSNSTEHPDGPSTTNTHNNNINTNTTTAPRINHDAPPTNTNTNTKKPLPLVADSDALWDNINELVSSEREYVRRLEVLKQSYADPLRAFSKSKETYIISAYSATTLFGNIDNLLPVNQAFLTDLEKMIGPNGSRTVGGVGDVALKHLRDGRGFELYRYYYAKREAAQAIFETELGKRDGRFASFIDNQKYQSTDLSNRVGLRELLMEPVQRIPRYTLLFREMIRHMSSTNPQREKLILADKLASSIAKAEPGEETKRAATLACLNAAIQGFPPDMISNKRRFVDCLDVEDVLRSSVFGGGGGSGSGVDASGSGRGGGSGAQNLHCSLFLFDDKLVIVKRPSNGEKGGRTLAGLDDIEKTSNKLNPKKKGPMLFKGVLDVCDVVATDVGGADIHLFLEATPAAPDLSERWANRPFRCLSVVNPPSSVNLDPVKTEADKKRFLDNLWTVQAKYRARLGQSVVLAQDEVEVESKGGRVTRARTFFNVYQRMAFLQEPKKTKVVVHIDALGGADNIPFGVPATSPPLVIIRVQPMPGDLCRYVVTCSDPNDEGEEDIVQTNRVPARVVHTIHQFGVFKFKTHIPSRPSTPTGGSTRSRAAKFGLDAISKTLFNSASRPLSASTSLKDFGSLTASSYHKRTKSTTSGSSGYGNSTVTSATNTTTEGESVAKFSYRSSSTAATTMSSMASNANGRDPEKTPGHGHERARTYSHTQTDGDDDDDERFFATRSASKSQKQATRKLMKRGKSPHSNNERGSDSEGVGSGTGAGGAGGLFRRARSIGRGSVNGSVASRSRSRTGSMSSAHYTSGEEDHGLESEHDDDDEVFLEDQQRRLAGGHEAHSGRGKVKRKEVDRSEMELAMRLDLARKNSKNQHGIQPTKLDTDRLGDTIYEEESLLARPESRASKQSSQHTVTPYRSDSRGSARPPSRASYAESHSRPESRNRGRSDSTGGGGADRRPRGPRSPSPLPPIPLSPNTAALADPDSPDELDIEKTLMDLTNANDAMAHIHTPVPKSQRQPSFTAGDLSLDFEADMSAIDMDDDSGLGSSDNPASSHAGRTPLGFPTGPPAVPVTPSHVHPQGTGGSIEPLSIKKTTSVRSDHYTPSALGQSGTAGARKNYIRNSPLSRGTSRIVSPRRVSPQMQRHGHVRVSGSMKVDEGALGVMVQRAKATKTDVDSARRVIKRIRLEVEKSSSSTSANAAVSRPSSPEKLPRTPSKTGAPITKEAMQRMEEMRQLIGRRSEDLTVSTSTPNRWRPTSEAFPPRNSIFPSNSTSSSSSDAPNDVLRTVEELAADADGQLSKASTSLEKMESELEGLVSDLATRFSEFEKAKLELQNVKRQCELVKSLLADATAEKDIMYEAFNEELDAMYSDVNLPEDEAWAAMSKDLQTTKESRNTLSNENSNLKRQLAEAELQRDQWGELLRSHGLIP